MSVYNPSIPQAADKLSASQAQILTNFTELDTQFGVDHTPFDNSGSNGDGFHKKVTHKVQGSDPGSAASQLVTYAKTSSGSSELFMQRDGVAGAIQLTKGTVNIGGNSTTPAAAGHSFLPGGLLIQWGSVAASAAGQAFNFDTVFSSIYSLTMGIQAAGAQSSSFGSVTTSGGVAFCQSGTQTINYIAIGI